MPVGIYQRSVLLFVFMVTVFCQLSSEPEFAELFEKVEFSMACPHLQGSASVN
jgi:hypothetical protein